MEFVQFHSYDVTKLEGIKLVELKAEMLPHIKRLHKATRRFVFTTKCRPMQRYYETRLDFARPDCLSATATSILKKQCEASGHEQLCMKDRLLVF